MLDAVESLFGICEDKEAGGVSDVSKVDKVAHVEGIVQA